MLKSITFYLELSSIFLPFIGPCAKPDLRRAYRTPSILCAYAPSPTRPTCLGQPSGDLFPVSARPDNPALAAPERFPPNSDSPCASPIRHSLSIRMCRVRRKRHRPPSSLLIDNPSTRQ